ncbi:hypothetical protein K7432_017205 [Basidiobolus ranarum]|uniref:Tryptophan synthase beta chain-like PALP domain-containing protein n=1 Tax=Basidiobolus ranarum TaxID=34480 RepID=A0ABR2WDP5_9FUNG
MTKTHSVTFEDVQRASERIAPLIHKTPVMTCSTLDGFSQTEASPDIRLFFKCEMFQKTGAFKFRGASNAVLQLSDEMVKNGVVTHSSGNHAQALALAAKSRNIPAYIVMPSTCPQVKKDAVKGYGAIITECEPNQQSRELAAQSIIDKLGATLVHPYNHPHIIAGQGTCMLEFYQQAEEMNVTLDALVLPIGGGGFISGCSIAAKALNPNVRIFGAEPANAKDAYLSFESKELIPNAKPPTSIAEGLLANLGPYAFPVVIDHLEKVFIVTEEQISDAMKMVWERMKLIIEGSAAVAVAVVLYNEEFRKLQGIRNIGIVLEGGNADLSSLPWLK